MCFIKNFKKLCSCDVENTSTKETKETSKFVTTNICYHKDFCKLANRRVVKGKVDKSKSLNRRENNI